MICSTNTCCALWTSAATAKSMSTGSGSHRGRPGFEPQHKYPCCWSVLEQDTLLVAEKCFVASKLRIFLWKSVKSTHQNVLVFKMLGSCLSAAHTQMSVKCRGYKSAIFTSPSVCRPCECNPSGTVDVCSPLDGRCHCKSNVEGGSCDRCVISFLLAWRMTCGYLGNCWIPAAQKNVSPSLVCDHNIVILILIAVQNIDWINITLTLHYNSIVM